MASRKTQSKRKPRAKKQGPRQRQSRKWFHENEDGRTGSLEALRHPVQRSPPYQLVLAVANDIDASVGDLVYLSFCDQDTLVFLTKPLTKTLKRDKFLWTVTEMNVMAPLNAGHEDWLVNNACRMRLSWRLDVDAKWLHYLPRGIAEIDQLRNRCATSGFPRLLDKVATKLREARCHPRA